MNSESLSGRASAQLRIAGTLEPAAATAPRTAVDLTIYERRGHRLRWVQGPREPRGSGVLEALGPDATAKLPTELVAQLAHPSIAPVARLQEPRRPERSQTESKSETSSENERWLLELHSTTSLAECIEVWHAEARDGRHSFPLRAGVQALIELCDAVQYAHSRGVAHTAIDAHYVLTHPSGRLQLVGFEHSVPLDRAAVSADVFGLGALLQQLLSGEPLSGQRQAAAARPASAPALNTPLGLESIATRALAADPAQRFAAPQELANELRAWLEDRSTALLQPSPLERARAAVRRAPGTALLAGAGLALLGILLATRDIGRAVEAAHLDRLNFVDGYLSGASAEQWLAAADLELQALGDDRSALLRGRAADAFAALLARQNFQLEGQDAISPGKLSAALDERARRELRPVLIEALWGLARCAADEPRGRSAMAALVELEPSADVQRALEQWIRRDGEAFDALLAARSARPAAASAPPPAPEQGPDLELERLAQIAFELRGIEAGAPLYVRAARKHPGRLFPAYFQGALELRRKQLSRALLYAARASAAEPQSWSARILLARSLARSGDVEEATRQIDFATAHCKFERDIGALLKELRHDPAR